MRKNRQAKRIKRTEASSTRAGSLVFWLSVSLLVLVPLAIITAVYRVYVLPKFVLLLIGSSALMSLVLWEAMKAKHFLNHLKSKHVLLVCLYFLAVSISTLFGAAPLPSLFGSVYNQMGLITQLCFLICFVGLIVGVSASELRFKRTLWTIALTGLVVALYALVQFFGFDPFVPSGMYTFDSTSGAQVRVASTLGHSNYLGNFLLYTMPLSAALAFATSGRARHLSLAGVVLSIAAIACSGTRGAWVGVVAGAIPFAVFGLSGGRNNLAKARSSITPRKAALSFIILAVFISAISLSPASKTILARFRSFTADKFTGSGRTILWRDSIMMVPNLPVTGGGPESFRKQFLSYKSTGLARLSPRTNNESSHNSYLDAAISYGLLGAILYIAIIVSALSLLTSARRRAATSSMKLIVTGIVASLVGVLVHNFFIYDQISTGLYFFAFIALAYIASSVVGARESEDRLKLERRSSAETRANQESKTAVRDHARTKAKSGDRDKPPGRFSATSLTRGLRWAIGVAVCVCVLALWYSVDLLQADMEIKQVLVSARQGNFDALVRHGERAASSVEPTGIYQFLFISLLTESISKMNGNATTAGKELPAKRSKALELAVAHSNKPLAHTLTPELNNLLLAYLAWAAGDIDRTYAYASEVLKWDPNNAEARWLMAEVSLAKGDRVHAAAEAKSALSLNQGSQEARAALAEARRIPLPQKIELLINRGVTLADTGDIAGARRLLTRALRKSKGKCRECHRALALLYEKANLYNDAISEWEALAREQPSGAAAKEAQTHLEMLRQKGGQ